MSGPFLPPIKQICDTGLSISSSLTFFLGDNGSGKSTLLQALAEASKIDVRGGHGGRRYASPNPAGKLSRHISLTGSLQAHTRLSNTYFLRAETALGVFSFMSDHGVSNYGPKHLAQISHGESFLQVMKARMSAPGLYLLDEPEAALSFDSCAWLLEHLVALAAAGAQIICATHSPILASARGASLLEFGSDGIVARAWEELHLVQQWRGFWATNALVD